MEKAFALKYAKLKVKCIRKQIETELTKRRKHNAKSNNDDSDSIGACRRHGNGENVSDTGDRKGRGRPRRGLLSGRGRSKATRS